MSSAGAPDRRPTGGGEPLHASGRQTARLGLAALGFVALGVFLVVAGLSEGLPAGLPLVLLGGVSVVVFGAAGAVGVARQLRGEALVEIVEAGLVLPHVGLLSWADLERVEVRDVAGQRVIGIWPRDLSILDRMPLGSRWLARLNLLTGFAPLSVPTVQAELSADELLARIAARAPGAAGGGSPGPA